MDRPEFRSRRLTGVAALVTATVAAFAAFAPTAAADPVDVKYGSCTSTNPGVAAPPADYTTTVTLTPQSGTLQAGRPITITWHYSISTAPPVTGIPIADAAKAKAKILIGGAATSTVTTDASASFPAAPVGPGKTFQIPDLTATFTPQAAGTYTLTPGDNEQDVAIGGIVITCKAGGAKAAATITVEAAPAGGPTSSAASSSSATPAATTSTSTLSTLPHTGFDGRWMVGVVGLAAVLGAGGLAATRRRSGQGGSHG